MAGRSRLSRARGKCLTTDTFLDELDLVLLTTIDRSSKHAGTSRRRGIALSAPII